MNDEASEKRDAYKAALEVTPTDGMLWYEYAVFLEREFEMPNEVVRAFEHATRLLPKCDLRLRLGFALVLAERADAGLAMLHECLAQNPRAHGYCFLSDAHRHLGNDAAAKAAAQQAIALDPKFEEAHYLLGEALRHESREVAITCYRAAIELDPHYALAWGALGRELAATHDSRPEAIAALRRAIELDGEDAWSVAFLANALWSSGQLSEADAWFQRAIATFPDRDDMKRWYAQFLARSDDSK